MLAPNEERDGFFNRNAGNLDMESDVESVASDDIADFSYRYGASVSDILELDSSNNVARVVFEHERDPPDSSINIFKRLICSEISSKTPIERIQFLLEDYPDWITRYGELRTVVEHAVLVDAPSPVLNLLIEHDPLCILERNRHGLFLLHVACIRNAPIDVIDRLLLWNKWDPDLEPSPLHYACFSSLVSLATVKLLARKNPDSFQFKDSQGWLPIHIACLNNVSLEVVQFLVRRKVSSVRETDSSGRLPLHLACSAGATLDVVRLLVEYFPDSVRVTDESIGLPLHALADGQEAAEGVLEFLLAKYPGGVRQANGDGHLPLHLACSRIENASLSLISRLLEADLNTILCESSNGTTPVTLAAREQGFPDDIKAFLVEKEVQAIQDVRNAVDDAMEPSPFPDLVMSEIWKFLGWNLATIEDVVASANNENDDGIDS